MMRIIFIIGLLLASLLSRGQDIGGQWHGLLETPNGKLRLVFHIEKEGDTYKATMDSPDQNVSEIPVSSVDFSNNRVTIEIKNLMAKYEGILGDNDTFSGKFTQAGMSFELNLSRKAIEKVVYARPQEPKPPYNYHVEEVKFHNSVDDITFGGTFTRPSQSGKYPVAVMITGSGAQNRDEEIFEHKPFKVIADHLAHNGIAVLRFDDRGVGESGGSPTATSADFANDVRAAVDFLKKRDDINLKQIGLIGHSEGGIIAPMVAADSNDIAFIVSLAGTGIPGDSLLFLQQRLIFKSQGMPDEEIKQAQQFNRGAFKIVKEFYQNDSLTHKLSDYFKENLGVLPASQLPQGMPEEQLIYTLLMQFANPWITYFIHYNPAPTLEKVKCPFLALNGSKDLQVPPKENLSAIENALKKGKNRKYKTKELANLNHLFQECETGALSEYIEIEQTVSPTALNEITYWLKSILKIK